MYLHVRVKITANDRPRASINPQNGGVTRAIKSVPRVKRARAIRSHVKISDVSSADDADIFT